MAEQSTIEKRKVRLKVITGGDADEVQSNVNDWLNESESQDILVGEENHRIQPDGTHVVSFLYVAEEG